MKHLPWFVALPLVAACGGNFQPAEDAGADAPSSDAVAPLEASDAPSSDAGADVDADCWACVFGVAPGAVNTCTGQPGTCADTHARCSEAYWHPGLCGDW